MTQLYYIGIRVTPAEKLRTHAAAAEAGVTMSEYVREAVLRRARPRALRRLVALAAWFVLVASSWLDRRES